MLLLGSVLTPAPAAAAASLMGIESCMLHHVSSRMPRLPLPRTCPPYCLSNTALHTPSFVHLQLGWGFNDHTTFTQQPELLLTPQERREHL